MPKSTINGCFYFKASHAQELMEDKTMQPIQVEVVKILQLTGQQFRDFSANLLRDMPFLIPNKNLTGYDKGVTPLPAGDHPEPQGRHFGGLPGLQFRPVLVLCPQQAEPGSAGCAGGALRPEALAAPAPAGAVMVLHGVPAAT